MADDEASRVYWHLSSLPDVVAVTDSFPADKPDNSSVPWIFVRNVYTRMEDVSIVKDSSTRMSEPVWYPVPDGDGLIRGGCFYSVGTFDNYGPVIQVGSGESGSGGDADG